MRALPRCLALLALTLLPVTAAAAPAWPPAASPPDDRTSEADAPVESPWGAPADPVAAPSAAITPRAPSPWGGTRSLDLVYTGGNGGVGSGAYVFSVLRTLDAAQAQLDGTLSGARPFNGALAQGPWLLHADDRRVSTLVALLGGGLVSCTPDGAARAWQTDTDVLVGPRRADDPLASWLDQRLDPAIDWQRLTCTGPGGATATLMGPVGAPDPAWTLGAWEFRKAIDLTWSGASGARSLTLTGVPVQDAARMFSAIESLRRERPGALFVDAGSFVDGASAVRDGALSLHRPLGFEMLRRLGPAALVPGATELVAGPRSFGAEAVGLPYVATNWRADDPALALPPYRIVTVDHPGGPLRVAFLGVLDPELQAWIPELARDGVQITHPIDSVQPVMDGLAALAEPPHAVVVLTTADGAVLADLRRRLRGVDLMAGDPTFATVRVEERVVQLHPLARDQKAAPLTVSLDGLATAQLVFEGDHLTTVRSRPRLLRGDVPRDPLASARVTETRAQVYPRLDTPLLGPPPGGPLATWSHDDWNRLVCEAIRLETGAHTVLLRDLPPPPSVPGPLTALQALDPLAMLDQLHEIRVPGDKLLRILDKAFEVAPVACGATSLAPTPDQRAIDPLRTYRVVTSDRTLHGTPLGTVLSGVSATGPLDAPGEVPLPGTEGRPLGVPAATLDGVREAGARAGDPSLAAPWLLDTWPSTVPSLWLLRMSQLSVRVDRFDGVEDETFAQVPETLATNPSSLTLAVAVDTALEHSSAATVWDLRLRSTYATLQTDAEGAEDLTLAEAETADDVRWSTSLSVPAWAIPAGKPVQAMPYTELLYDTEVSPTLDETGVENPKQRDLSLTAGLAARPVGALRTLRVGAFANRDLSRLDEKPTEYGGRLEVGTSKRLVDALTWTTLADLQLWANTRDDDPSDLRFRALAETRLALPLARWLAISTYAQGFALRGRVPETDTLGAAWTLGAALDMAGAFELDRQPGR